MSSPFRVVEADDARGRAEYLVINTEDADRPVAEFGDRRAAEDHAERLNRGPLDWDEQEAWQDDWDDDWGDDDRRGDTPDGGRASTGGGG